MLFVTRRCQRSSARVRSRSCFSAVRSTALALSLSWSSAAPRPFLTISRWRAAHSTRCFLVLSRPWSSATPALPVPLVLGCSGARPVPCLVALALHRSVLSGDAPLQCLLLAGAQRYLVLSDIWRSRALALLCFLTWRFRCFPNLSRASSLVCLCVYLLV